MKRIWAQTTTFVGVYAGSMAFFWGVVEICTYFTGYNLRKILGDYWILVFFGGPLLIAALAITVLMHQRELSREELDKFESESIDRTPTGEYKNLYENVDLSNSELRRRIKERNKNRQPTYKLRKEYQRRLGH